MNGKELDPTLGKLQTNLDTRPTPDPTVLTTQMVLREVAALREIIEARLDCADEDFKRLYEQLQSREHDIVKEVKQLQEIVDGQFKKVDLQFKLIEQQRIEQKADTKSAVDAALTAQKEDAKNQTLASEKAINKNELATVKQIDLQAELFRTAGSSTDKQVNDLKERITTLEGRSSGHGETWGWVVAGVVVVGILVDIFSRLIH